MYGVNNSISLVPVVSSEPLVSFPQNCVVGRFLRRHKRFSVAVALEGKEVWIHSNNSGAMLGLLHSGLPVLLSPAANAKRKLPYTQECIWLPHNMSVLHDMSYDCMHPQAFTGQDGFWVGVNTSVPNKVLYAAFYAGLLPFTKGYTVLQREATRLVKQTENRVTSRLDACFTGENMPPLWVECKNVTMVEDNVACFPDAVTERGQKHLRELMNIVRSGQRAVMFYLVQRADGHCFGPADFIDPVYAQLFWQAVDVGVEIWAFRARIDMRGIYLGERLPLAGR